MKVKFSYFVNVHADSAEALLNFGPAEVSKLGLKKLSGPGNLISDVLFNIKNTPPTRPIIKPTIKNPIMKPATEPLCCINFRYSSR
jgi:hypothetical protein